MENKMSLRDLICRMGVHVPVREPSQDEGATIRSFASDSPSQVRFEVDVEGSSLKILLILPLHPIREALATPRTPA